MDGNLSLNTDRQLPLTIIVAMQTRIRALQRRRSFFCFASHWSLPLLLDGRRQMKLADTASKRCTADSTATTDVALPEAQKRSSPSAYKACSAMLPLASNIHSAASDRTRIYASIFCYSMCLRCFTASLGHRFTTCTLLVYHFRH